MPNNFIKWIKSANPVEIFAIARRLADCNGVCPAQCMDDAEKCFNELPYQCVMRFKKWAMKEEK